MIAKLVQKTPTTRVYDTYTYCMFKGVYKPTTTMVYGTYSYSSWGLEANGGLHWSPSSKPVR